MCEPSKTHTSGIKIPGGVKRGNYEKIVTNHREQEVVAVEVTFMRVTHTRRHARK